MLPRFTRILSLVRERRDVIGVESKSTIEGLDGALVVAQHRENDAAIVMGLRIVRRRRDGQVQKLEGLVGLLQILERARLPAQDLGVVGGLPPPPGKRSSRAASVRPVTIDS